jgi:hypothetical protein
MIERFLFLFAAYRAALDRAQRAEDQILVATAALDVARKRVDELTDKFIGREQELTDRAMAVKFGPRALLTAEQIAAGLGQVEPRAPRATDQQAYSWREQQQRAASAELEKFIATHPGS